MTRQRSFKSRVRARMEKTGESYTSARRQLIGKSQRSGVRSRPPEAVPESAASVASSTSEDGQRRMSDEVLRARTGRSWDGWFELLDEWGATQHSHAEIARWLVDEHAVNSWWAQSISIGYEHARGMRAVGQQHDGDFAASASKTVAVTVDRLFTAFTDAQLRNQWLPDAPLQIRTSRAPKSLTASWDDGTSRLSVYFTDKGEKSQVAIQHLRLSDAEAASHMKAFWRTALIALKQLLES